MRPNIPDNLRMQPALTQNLLVLSWQFNKEHRIATHIRSVSKKRQLIVILRQ